MATTIPLLVAVSEEFPVVGFIFAMALLVPGFTVYTLARSWSKTDSPIFFSVLGGQLLGFLAGIIGRPSGCLVHRSCSFAGRHNSGNADASEARKIMSTNALEQLSPLLSNPTRLAVVAGLDGCVKSDFQTIKQQLSVTDSTLSKHITALEKEGLVDVKKGFVGKKTKTTLSLSTKGREVFEAHMQGLKEIARMSFDEGE